MMQPVVDIVVDTNVLAHANNRQEPRQKAALEFIQALFDGTTILCIDEGFSAVEAKNRSLIWHEYQQHLPHGTIGSQLIVKLVFEKRVRMLPRRPAAAVSRAINQLLSNKYDRTFLGVAYNSEGHCLVSHDLKDFSQSKRRDILKKFSVKVIEASEC